MWIHLGVSHRTRGSASKLWRSGGRYTCYGNVSYWLRHSVRAECELRWYHERIYLVLKGWLAGGRGFFIGKIEGVQDGRYPESISICLRVRRLILLRFWEFVLWLKIHNSLRSDRWIFNHNTNSQNLRSMSIRQHMQSNRNGFRMADILEDFKEFQTGRLLLRGRRLAVTKI